MMYPHSPTPPKALCSSTENLGFLESSNALVGLWGIGLLRAILRKL